MHLIWPLLSHNNGGSTPAPKSLPCRELKGKKESKAALVKQEKWWG